MHSACPTFTLKFIIVVCHILLFRYLHISINNIVIVIAFLRACRQDEEKERKKKLENRGVIELN